MSTITERTTREEQRIAKSTISMFRETSNKLIKMQSNVVKIKVQDEGKYMEIPPKAFSLLFDILYFILYDTAICNYGELETFESLPIT